MSHVPWIPFLSLWSLKIRHLIQPSRPHLPPEPITLVQVLRFVFFIALLPGWHFLVSLIISALCLLPLEHKLHEIRGKLVSFFVDHSIPSPVAPQSLAHTVHRFHSPAPHKKKWKHKNLLTFKFSLVSRNTEWLLYSLLAMPIILAWNSYPLSEKGEDTTTP